MKVKLDDVALEAGVSVATVSRVLNNHAVSPKARKKVEEAIAKLDYRPNLIAKGLSQGKSFRVGVIVSNMENPYFSSIMNAIESRLRKEGYLCHFVGSSERGEEEVEIIRSFFDSGIDGIILVDVGKKRENSGFYASLNQKIPVVIINGNPDRTDTNLIMVDQEKGMGKVMDFLFDLNHQRIAFICGAGISLSFEIKEKVFLEKMKDKGFLVDENSIVKIDDFDHFETIGKTADLITRILKLENRPTAIFASNEIMALGVLKAARDLGLDVPGDLSVITQDNTYLSRISTPEMTTIDMNTPRLGNEAAEMILTLMKSENPSPRRLIFYPEIVVRDSCRKI